jgi:hypothetical protein
MVPHLTNSDERFWFRGIVAGASATTNGSLPPRDLPVLVDDPRHGRAHRPLPAPGTPGPSPEPNRMSFPDRLLDRHCGDMRRRAERYGERLQFATQPGGGSQLTWTARVHSRITG